MPVVAAAEDEIADNIPSGSEESELEDAEAWDSDPGLDPDNRLSTTSWRVCQNCGTMPTVKESVCHQELNWQWDPVCRRLLNQEIMPSIVDLHLCVWW